MKQSARWFKSTLLEVGLKQIDLHQITGLTASRLSVMANTSGCGGQMVALLEAYRLMTPVQRKSFLSKFGVAAVDDVITTERIQKGEHEIIIEEYKGGIFILDLSKSTPFSYSFDASTYTLVIELPGNPHVREGTKIDRVFVDDDDTRGVDNRVTFSFRDYENVQVVSATRDSHIFVYCMG